MLKRLSVENYALIDKLDIAFAPGLNIITGETGAGKSILLGALGLILGNRGDVAAIRDAQRNCVIEAEFDLSGYRLEGLFASFDIDYDQQCMIRRVITPAGKSRAYVNDLPVQLAALRAIGERLIDIHSQHQTLLLGESRFQTALLDSVAAHAQLLEQYGSVYDELNRTQRERDELLRLAAESGKDREYIAYQLEELQAARLAEGEQEELESLLDELSHAVEIKDNLLYAAQVLDGDEQGVLTRLKGIEQAIGRLQGVYPQAGQFYQRLHSAALDLKDIASEITSEGDRIEADPLRQEQTRERLDLIYSLQQKHKVDSVAALLALQAGYEQRLSGLDSYGSQVEELTLRIETLLARAGELAASITAGRRAAGPKVEQHVTGLLVQLGMPSAQLRIEVAPAGEMSRLMLSLKALVAAHAQLPTIIFDEIDTGVSGAIADKMGEIITNLSGSLQVVNITHLPQVASKGDHHFLVYKEETPEGTLSRIRKLSSEARVAEIAKMLSGSAVTAAATEQARLLLGMEKL